MVFFIQNEQPIMTAGCVFPIALSDDIVLNLLKKRGQTYESNRYS